VQQARQRWVAYQGRIGRRREAGQGRPGCGREFRWDLRGVLPSGGGGRGDRRARGNPGSHHAIGTRGRPEPRPGGSGALYYCARALIIISPLQAAAGRSVGCRRAALGVRCGSAPRQGDSGRGRGLAAARRRPARRDAGGTAER
jgi:hypothetical protein